MKLTQVFRFTLFELILVVVVLLIAAGMILPAFQHHHGEPAVRINCAGNLKQIGLALRMYTGDNNDVFPDGVGCYDDSVGLNLLVERRYLSAMKVFICPSTETRTVSGTYLAPESVSYRYHAGHTEDSAATHVDTNGNQRTYTFVSISRDIETNHTRFGNILFGDSHVKGFSGHDWLTNSNF